MCLCGERIEKNAVFMPGISWQSRAVVGQRAQFASDLKP